MALPPSRDCKLAWWVVGERVSGVGAGQVALRDVGGLIGEWVMAGLLVGWAGGWAGWGGLDWREVMGGWVASWLDGCGGVGGQPPIWMIIALMLGLRKLRSRKS